MNNRTRISIISTAEGALRKLKRAQIAVFNCKKEGAAFIFEVKDKDTQKVFAIFDKPCYNITVIRKSRKNSLLSLLAVRAGLVAGAAAFVIACVAANSFVLKIKVSGSGSYLEPEVRKIVYDEGAREFQLLSSFNFSVATGRILALPQVTFCNIEKRGSVLVVDVQVDEEHYGSADLKPLVSDCNGTVRNIVAVCGTAAVNVGDGVKKGDTLIYAHTLAGEEEIECIAAGFAEIECSGHAEYFAEEDSEENLKEAYASVLLDDENILTRSHSVNPTEGGVVYFIEYTFLHRISINLS
ncbi:MAG: sporulation protein YqfD [Clostridia bacterium]|nr:sporulation protein YqfD [Clostridia bacterium]